MSKADVVIPFPMRDRQSVVTRQQWTICSLLLLSLAVALFGPSLFPSFTMATLSGSVAFAIVLVALGCINVWRTALSFGLSWAAVAWIYKSIPIYFTITYAVSSKVYTTTTAEFVAKPWGHFLAACLMGLGFACIVTIVYLLIAEEKPNAPKDKVEFPLPMRISLRELATLGIVLAGWLGCNALIKMHLLRLSEFIDSSPL